jgi:2-polyprenyl-3-methyl-5-hydroxy-6-metoxy-1,4-benzoquinol methylase
MDVDKPVELQQWPSDGIELVEKCPVCGSKERRCVYTDLSDRVFFCAPGLWTLYQCRDCGSAYLDPRPTQATIGRAYTKYFTHETGARADFASLKLSGKIRRTLANGYRNWRFGSSYQPQSFLGVIAAMILPRYRLAIDAQMRHLPREARGRSLLDFGCGNGAFVAIAKDAGWNAVGMEIDPAAVRVAKNKGLEVVQGGIEAMATLDRKFDVITMSHVIEHVHDPARLLRLCYRCLKPGGFVWIETPNYNSQGHGIYGRNWRGLESPRHLVLFTCHSLLRLLKDVGFHKIHHQKENPVVPMIFGASEAIQAGDEPFKDWKKWAQKKQGQWRNHMKMARKKYQMREFISITAHKTLGINE